MTQSTSTAAQYSAVSFAFVKSAVDNVDATHNSYRVSTEKLSKLKSAAQQRSIDTRLCDEFKAALDASELSPWVAYKLSVCQSSRQTDMYAFFLSNNRKITTSDIDAINRHANERTSLTFAEAVANIETLKQSSERIVYRARKSDDAVSTSVETVSADDVARAHALNVEMLHEATRYAQTLNDDYATLSRVNALNVEMLNACAATLRETTDTNALNVRLLHEATAYAAQITSERDAARALATEERIALQTKQNARKQKSVKSVTVA